MGLKQFHIDDQKVITGLDLGAKAVKCVMGVVNQDGSIEIAGASELEHNGIQNQQIVDTRKVISAVRRVCQEVEIISERSITDLWVALSNPFCVFPSEGMAVIGGGQASRRHIQQAVSSAVAVPLPDHQEAVHVLPVSFRVDRKDSVYNPAGLSGLRLETSVLLVTCDISSIQDLKRCVSSAGRTARGFVIQSLASGLAAAGSEDKNKGVCVVDIGKNCSQASVFFGGRCVDLFHVDKGGENITGGLVNQLKIPPQLAEQLKLRHGILYEDADCLSETDSFSISAADYKNCLHQSLSACFEPLREKLLSKEYKDQIRNGIIFTGGGALLKNLDLWARSYFNKPVRLGRLNGGSDSFAEKLEYSSGLGLLYYAKDDRLDFKEQHKMGPAMSVRSWFRDLIS